jgi:hypothetical protein
MKRLALLLLLLPLAACNPLAPTPEVATPTVAPATAPATPGTLVLPEGGSCTGDIARYRAIQDNDLAMGHVAKSVYERSTRRSRPRSAPPRPNATPDMRRSRAR